MSWLAKKNAPRASFLVFDREDVPQDFSVWESDGGNGGTIIVSWNGTLRQPPERHLKLPDRGQASTGDFELKQIDDATRARLEMAALHGQFRRAAVREWGDTTMPPPKPWPPRETVR